MSSSEFNGSGITFGNYEVVAGNDGKPLLLGEGAFGKTYRAEHKFLRSTVALKVIHEHFAFNSGIKKRFLVEAQAMAQLRHPHVAQILDCGDSDGTLYYAVEFCQGGDLDQIVRQQGRMAPARALMLIRQAAEALEFVHEHGFLHRDLKPSNLMLANSHGGNAPLLKVIDFGLVKQLDQGATVGMTETGQFLGTLHYASPEQLREEALDVRTDIFSLGVTLWFLLKGEVPFETRRATMVTERLAGSGYEPLLAKEWPAAVRALVADMVALRRDARPATMREVLERIEACLDQMSSARALMAGGEGTPPGPATDGAREDKSLSEPRLILASADSIKEEFFELAETEQEVELGVRYRARNRKTGQRLAMTFVRRNLAADPVFVKQLERVIANVQGIAPDHFIQPVEMMRFRDRLVLAEEWVEGPDLLTLLRHRRGLSLREAAPVLSQLSAACDTAVQAGLGGLQLTAYLVTLQLESGGWSEWTDDARNTMLGRPLSEWPPFKVKIAPDYLSENAGSESPGLSSLLKTVVRDGEKGTSLASRFARLVYRIVAGRPVTAAAMVSRSAYVSIARLSEESNLILSRCISGGLSSKDCRSILENLWIVERLPMSAIRGAALAARAQPMAPAHDHLPVSGSVSRERNEISAEAEHQALVSRAELKAEREKIERESAEREKTERERLERERAEREKAEREKAEREQAERERIEREEAERVERERFERERAEREKAERERLEREQAERERIEHEEAERAERERVERERAEREKIERERLEREQAERERIEHEEAERAERERVERERAEREKIERERLEREQAEREWIEREEAERAERERLEGEQAERERIEREEAERAERERAEREQAEREKAEREKAERERIERERAEREKAEREKEEREKEEREKAERERAEREEAERAERERAEREKAERERFEREQAERERIEHEEAERAERERVERERAEREKAERERLEREQAERERIEHEEAERAERERLEREQAERERIEREEAERAERERAEREQAERKKAEREKAERERIERERAERERAERERAEREQAELKKAEQEKIEREKAKREKAEQKTAERERAERQRVEREALVPSNRREVEPASSPETALGKSRPTLPMMVGVAGLIIGAGVIMNWFLTSGTDVAPLRQPDPIVIRSGQASSHKSPEPVSEGILEFQRDQAGCDYEKALVSEVPPDVKKLNVGEFGTSAIVVPLGDDKGIAPLHLSAGTYYVVFVSSHLFTPPSFLREPLTVEASQTMPVRLPEPMERGSISIRVPASGVDYQQALLQPLAFAGKEAPPASAMLPLSISFANGSPKVIADLPAGSYEVALTSASPHVARRVVAHRLAVAKGQTEVVNIPASFAGRSEAVFKWEINDAKFTIQRMINLDAGLMTGTATDTTTFIIPKMLKPIIKTHPLDTVTVDADGVLKAVLRAKDPANDWTFDEAITLKQSGSGSWTYHFTAAAGARYVTSDQFNVQGELKR